MGQTGGSMQRDKAERTYQNMKWTKEKNGNGTNRRIYAERQSRKNISKHEVDEKEERKWYKSEGFMQRDIVERSY